MAELSRARIQALIKEGLVTVNGGAAKASLRLRVGEEIRITVPEPRPAVSEPQDLPLEILYEDEILIVLNKAAGMVVHPAAGNWDGTIVNALLHHCQALSGVGGESRPGIVHRLDKDTSGCLVAAKSDAAHRSLSRQFAGREIQKIYLALAKGRFSRKSGSIEAAIARHPVQRQKMAVTDGSHGRAAHTSWRVLRELPPIAGGGIPTLVECTLHTGRTHQIRVHLQHLGHPLFGDAVYGSRGPYPRQMLHAWKLGFTHPESGRPLHFIAPIPADFLEAGIPSNPDC